MINNNKLYLFIWKLVNPTLDYFVWSVNFPNVPSDALGLNLLLPKDRTPRPISAVPYTARVYAPWMTAEYLRWPEKTGAFYRPRTTRSSAPFVNGPNVRLVPRRLLVRRCATQQTETMRNKHLN